MKKLFTLISFIFIISCNNQNNTQTNEEDKLYRDLKEISKYSDYDEINGSTIDNFHAISTNENIKIKGTYIVVFEQINHYGNSVKFRILDKLLIENLPENQFIGHGGCRLNGKVDDEIIILYEDEGDVEYYTKIKKAWRAERKTKKIIEIDTKGIDYLNEGYGV